MRKTQVHKTFKVTIYSITAICIVYMLLAVPATIIYGSSPDGIMPNVISNMPSASIWATFINVLMALSCMCSLPVLLSSTTELLEATCKSRIG